MSNVGEGQKWVIQHKYRSIFERSRKSINTILLSGAFYGASRLENLGYKGLPTNCLPFGPHYVNSALVSIDGIPRKKNGDHGPSPPIVHGIQLKCPIGMNENHPSGKKLLYEFREEFMSLYIKKL